MGPRRGGLALRPGGRHAGACVAALVAACALIECVPSLAQAGAGEGRLDVRVADAAGEPVGGATVTAWDRARARVARGTTDDEGAVLLRGAIRDDGTVLVNATGFVPRRAPVSAAVSGVLRLRLDVGASLVVLVEEAGSARPIPSFDLTAMPADAALGGPDEAALLAESAVRAVAHDSDGRLTVRGLPDGPVLLLVRAAGFPPTPHGPVDPGATREVRVTLDASGCITHFVLDARTGAPLEGARAVPDVPLRESVGNDALLEIGRSAEDGALTLCPAGRGPERVVVSRGGFAPVVVDAPRPDDEETAPREIRLAPAAWLDVRVAFPDGRPVDGALVRVEAGGRSTTVRASESGLATFAGLAADDDARVEVRLAEGDAPAAEASLRLVPGARHDLALDVAAAVTVTTLFDGRPVAEAPAYLAERASFALDVFASSWSDLDGVARFHVAGAMPEQTVLVLRSDEGALFLDWDEAAPIDDDPRRRVVDVGGRTVEGRIVTEQGVEVAGAVLACTRLGTATDQPVWGIVTGEEGELRFDRAGRDIVLLRPGSVAVSDARGRFRMRVPGDCGMLRVSGPEVGERDAPWGRAQVAWWDEPENSPIEVVLSRRATLAVRVSGPPGRTISVFARHVGALHDPRVVRLAETGERVRIDVPDEGPWVLHADGAGFVGVAGPLAAPPGEIIDVEIPIAEGGSVIVPLPREDGDRLHVVDERGVDWTLLVGVRPADTDAGAYVVGPLPPGTYAVVSGRREASVRLTYPGEVREAF